MVTNHRIIFTVIVGFLASCVDIDGLLKGGDPTISIVEDGDCRIYTFECYGGCATDVSWSSFTSTGEQCGIQEGSTAAGCWPAIMSEDGLCAYADFYMNTASTSTCMSVTLTLCDTTEADAADAVCWVDRSMAVSGDS